MQIILSDIQDRLIKGLSHRMNNILTLFHGYLGLLLDNEKLDPVTLEGLEKIKDGARIATELMDRTNAIVSPTNLTPRGIVMEQFLTQLLPTFEKIAGTTKITIECSKDTVQAWADPSRVRLALTEIVKNACEAAGPTGNVRIVVAPADSAPEKAMFPRDVRDLTNWTTISVIDDGPGIAISVEDKVYEPFTTTKKKQAIAGLGLTVAVNCMRQIGGGIDHESTKGRTVFRLTLPVHDGVSARAVA